VENNVTAENKTPDQIQDEMARTRASITEKVATLENQVIGTAQTAASTISGTVEAVKSLVEAAPDAVKQAATAVTETVKSAFNISGTIRDNPWTAVSVSAGLGFITGLIVFRDHAAAVVPVPAMPVASPPSGKPGVFDELLSMLGRKARVVAENLIDSATAAVNDNVRANVPKLVDAAAEMATDRLGAAASGPPRAGGYHG
jgi:ElaB/YqjD/DUF883 family membrane-anchored ribosome-binding protein